MKTIARLLAFLSVALSSLLYVRISAPINPLRGTLWILRLLAEAITPFIALGGAVAAGLGLLARAPVAMLTRALGAVAAASDVRQVRAPHPGFEQAFGVAWERAIAPEQQRGMLQRRWSWHLPAAPEPRWQRDVTFWTLPDADRRLLCDLWQPPRGVAPSGLAFVYLHGGAWYLLDKDFFTRPFFGHRLRCAGREHSLSSRRARVRPRFAGLLTRSTDGVVLPRALPGAHAVMYPS